MLRFRLSAFADEAADSLDDQLAVLEQENIPCLELRGADGKNCADLTLEEADRIRQKLDAHGIELSAFGSPYGKYPIQEPFEPHMEKFRHGLALCKHLGCTRIRMFSFFVPENEIDRWEQEVFDRLEQMLDAAEKAGMKLLHENEKGIYGYSHRNCRHLMDRFEDRMGFIFDPANFLQCGIDTMEAFELLRDRITYLHIKDALRANGIEVRAGCGDGNIPELLKRLNARRTGDMILTLEPHLTAFSGFGTLQSEKLKGMEHYASQRESFHAACDALKGILAEITVSDKLAQD